MDSTILTNIMWQIPTIFMWQPG